MLRLVYGRYRRQLVAVYKPHINTTAKGFVIVADAKRHGANSAGSRRFIRSRHLSPVTFPEPHDRKVNMMPFIIGVRESLPEELQAYWPLIMACNPTNEEVGLHPPSAQVFAFMWG